jgi:hypothetical protein
MKQLDAEGVYSMSITHYPLFHRALTDYINVANCEHARFVDTIKKGRAWYEKSF